MINKPIQEEKSIVLKSLHKVIKPTHILGRKEVNTTGSFIYPDLLQIHFLENKADIF